MFANLISNTKITGRPSDYLRELLAIVSKIRAGDELVRHRFIQALPPNIAPVVVAKKSLTIRDRHTCR